MIKKYFFIITIMSAFIACDIGDNNGDNNYNNGSKDSNTSKHQCLPGQLCPSS